MRTVFSLLALVVLFITTAPGVPSQTIDDHRGHVEWVASALKEMQSIKVGMTRRALLRIFTTESGISTPLSRQYVYRACPYFKVRVEFQTAKGGNDSPKESPEDRITKISTPYIDWTIVD